MDTLDAMEPEGPSLTLATSGEAVGTYASPPDYDFTSTATAISTVNAGQLSSEHPTVNFWRSARWRVR